MCRIQKNLYLEKSHRGPVIMKTFAINLKIKCKVLTILPFEMQVPV